MRSLAFLIPLFFCVPSAAQGDVATAGGVRLLVLETVAKDGVSEAERELVQALVTDALRGKEDLLVADDDDVRRRAPMESDRLGNCEDELCLYELAEALTADWVLFSTVRQEGGSLVVEIGTFETARGETASEQVTVASVSTGSTTVTAAVERLLAPILLEAKPQLFEQPLFLGGVGVLTAGLLVFAGAGGWALELESNLASPERHRDEKAKALAQGPLALAVAGGGAAVTLVGAGLLTWALVSAE